MPWRFGRGLICVKAADSFSPYVEGIPAKRKSLMMTSQHLTEAAKFAPLIERVHGEHHPELTRVRELTEQLQDADSPETAAELFAELRSVTSNYKVPSDGCEAYQATYHALERADAEQQSVTA